MSTAAYIIILDRDISNEVASATLNAIRQIRHVADVVPHEGTIEISIAQTRARLDIAEQLWAVLREKE